MRRIISVLTAFSLTLISLSFFNSSNVNAKVNEPIEVVSLRSEYGKQFDNGDGTITSFINTAPIHYFENNEWNEIDNSLVIDEKGNYTNTSNNFKITLPSIIEDEGISESDAQNAKLEYMDHYFSILLNELSVCDMQIMDHSIEKSVNHAEIYIESNNKLQFDNKLPQGMSDSFKRISSSARYNSIFDNTDLLFNINPKTLSESLSFNNESAIPNTISFFIQTDCQLLENNEDHDYSFVDEEGTTLFTLLSPSISDSSNTNEYAEVKTEINEENNGYSILMHINDAVDEMDSPVYPLRFYTQYTVQRDSHTLYNSEASPNNTIYDSYLAISNETGGGYQTFVSCDDLFTGYSGNVTITDANFNMFLIGNYPSTPLNIQVYSNNTQPINYSWNYASSLNNDNTFITDFYVSSSDMYSWKSVDITNLFHSWVNYVRTNYVAGVSAYGFKMIANGTPTSTIVALSERASFYQPYFEITYVVDSNYTLTYAPHKYNNITYGSSNIYNYQKRMNCYAYALQIYDRGSINNSVHLLYPGEIGLLQNGTNYTITQLYNSYDNAPNIGSFMDFTEQQMFNDSAEMGTNLTKIILANNNQFVLPSSFNENNQRIIAMNAAYRYYDAPNSMPAVSPPYDFHFYLRHGNGTCTIHNDGVCSMWSHKLGSEKVSNEVNNIVLCDANIASQAKQLIVYGEFGVINSYSQTLRFYTIEQDTNVYDSWYIYNNVQTPTSYHN